VFEEKGRSGVRNKMLPQDYLKAARVPKSLEPQTFGLWTIERRPERRKLCEPWSDYTLLHRVTLASLHMEPGEVVMEDSARELSRHLPIWLNAHGRILVTGLGLGCVVRGLLASPRVEHIDVLEIDRRIIDVVGAEFYEEPRVMLHHVDALRVRPSPDAHWNFAWHDIWSEGEEGLQLLHGRLMILFENHCDNQGAWGFPRWAKHLMPTKIVG